MEVSPAQIEVKPVQIEIQKEFVSKVHLLVPGETIWAEKRFARKLITEGYARRVDKPDNVG